MSEPGELLHVHGDSMRIGIRLAWIMFTQHAPTESEVKRVEDTAPPKVRINDFPLNVITRVMQNRQDRRRETANHAMQILLAKAGDLGMGLKDADLETIATKAWKLAAMMEIQESVSASMDSLSPSEFKPA